MPLPVTICNGVQYFGPIYSSTKSATVSALLSGTGKASGQPLYQSTNPIIYLLPDRIFGYGLETSKPKFCKMGKEKHLFLVGVVSSF